MAVKSEESDEDVNDDCVGNAQKEIEKCIQDICAPSSGKLHNFADRYCGDRSLQTPYVQPYDDPERESRILTWGTRS